MACTTSAEQVGESEFTSGYIVGDIAADFRLKNVDGKVISLSDFEEAKGFIVVFTCNTCPYSKLYEERIKSLEAKYSVKGYPLIAINPNDSKVEPGDSFQEMVKRAKEKGFKFPYVQDETQQVTKAFGATNTPHVYVLDRNRKVIYIGSIDNNARSPENADKFYVEDAIGALEKNALPEVTKTKAIGCTIKWAK